jgi:uncharacterized membrane protein
MLSAVARPDDRHGLAARRAMLALALGLIVLVVTLVLGVDWTIAVTVAWAAAAFTIVVRVWLRIRGMSPADTRAHAQAEDFSRPASDVAVLAACAASLIAVGFLLVRAGRHTGSDKALLIFLAIVVVAVSWATVHTIYVLKYGDLYYGVPEGGIDFNDRDQPDYRDFAYLAFTIGMTYQVSDTSLQAKALRRVALRHALLSFLFGAVILAVAINTVASLLQ